MSAFGNSAYIPLTLIEIFPVTLPAVADKFGLEIPTLYVGVYLLVLSPLLWSVGNFLVSGSSGKIKLKDFLSAPLIGILAGFTVVFLHLQPVLFNPRLPFFHIYSALDRIAPVTLPLIMISLGSMIATLSYKKGENHSRIKVTLYVSLIRFLFFPALFFSLYFLLFKKLALSPVQIWVIFLEMHISPLWRLRRRLMRIPYLLPCYLHIFYTCFCSLCIFSFSSPCPEYYDSDRSTGFRRIA